MHLGKAHISPPANSMLGVVFICSNSALDWGGGFTGVGMQTPRSLTITQPIDGQLRVRRLKHQDTWQRELSERLWHLIPRGFQQQGHGGLGVDMALGFLEGGFVGGFMTMCVVPFGPIASALLAKCRIPQSAALHQFQHLYW